MKGEREEGEREIIQKKEGEVQRREKAWKKKGDSKEKVFFGTL